MAELLALLRLLRNAEGGAVVEGATKPSSSPPGSYVRHARTLLDRVLEDASASGQAEDERPPVLLALEQRVAALEQAEKEKESREREEQEERNARQTELDTAATGLRARKAVDTPGASARPRPAVAVGHSVQDLGASPRNDRDLRRELGLDSGIGGGGARGSKGASLDQQLEAEQGVQEKLLAEVDSMARAMKDTAEGWNERLKESTSKLSDTESLVDKNLSKVDGEQNKLQASLKMASATSKWTCAAILFVVVMSFVIYLMIKIVPKSA